MAYETPEQTQGLLGWASAPATASVPTMGQAELLAEMDRVWQEMVVGNRVPSQFLFCGLIRKRRTWRGKRFTYQTTLGTFLRSMAR